MSTHNDNHKSETSQDEKANNVNGTRSNLQSITNDMLAIIEATAEKIRTLSPHDQYLIGQAVDAVITAVGGNTSTDFLVTEALTKLVPFGARRLRQLRQAYLHSLVIDEVAAAVGILLDGDPWADALGIGNWVGKVIEASSGTPATGVEPLAKRLGVSTASLLRFWRARQVFDLGGSELSKLVPERIPTTVLPMLAPLMKGNSPMATRTMINKAARIIVTRKLRGKKIAALVSSILAEGGDKPPAAPAVAAAWHRPSKPSRTASFGIVPMVA